MDHFPEKWLPIIAKHLRKQIGLLPETPLPDSVQRGLERLRAAEIARLKDRVD